MKKMVGKKGEHPMKEKKQRKEVECEKRAQGRPISVGALGGGGGMSFSQHPMPHARSRK